MLISLHSAANLVIRTILSYRDRNATLTLLSPKFGPKIITEIWRLQPSVTWTFLTQYISHFFLLFLQVWDLEVVLYIYLFWNFIIWTPYMYWTCKFPKKIYTQNLIFYNLVRNFVNAKNTACSTWEVLEYSVKKTTD